MTPPNEKPMHTPEQEWAEKIYATANYSQKQLEGIIGQIRAEARAETAARLKAVEEELWMSDSARNMLKLACDENFDRAEKAEQERDALKAELEEERRHSQGMLNDHQALLTRCQAAERRCEVLVAAAEDFRAQVLAQHGPTPRVSFNMLDAALAAGKAG